MNILKTSKKYKNFTPILMVCIYMFINPSFSQQKDNYQKTIHQIEKLLLSEDVKNSLEKIDSILLTDNKILSKKNNDTFKTFKVEALTRGLLFEESLILSKELLNQNELDIYHKIRILINNALAYEYVGKFKDCEKQLNELKYIYIDNLVEKNIFYGRYLYRTSSFYRVQGLNKEGLIYANKALEFGVSNNYDEVKAVATMLIGFLSPKKNRKIYFNKTLKFYKNINNIKGMSGMYLSLGHLKDKETDYKNALKYYDSVINILKNNNYHELYATSYLQKSQIFEKTNQLDSAIYNLKKYNNYSKKDKIQKQQIKVSHLTFNYNIEKENLLSNNKIKVQKTTNYYQRIALFLLAIGFVSIFVFLRKTIKDKKDIINQKTQTENALQEKDILLKEVHHRVKNNLQVINSILDIQNSKIEDDRFNKILEEGQNRIQSMALIHQQLYQSDTIVDISIEKYIKELVANIARFYPDKKIEFNILANEIKFKINTSVPLGLIINELITNIYKHAFKKGEEGNVIININKTATHHYKLIVKDNGKGFHQNFNTKNSDSLGLKLINILTKQLKGTYNCSNDSGVKCIITFRDDVAV